MNREINSFINKYVKEIQNNSAALFLGAGFSKSAGFVDWKELIRGIAEELGLEVDKEHDLVALAQYCYNKKGNRSIINDTIFNEFNKDADLNNVLDVIKNGAKTYSDISSKSHIETSGLLDKKLKKLI